MVFIQRKMQKPLYSLDEFKQLVKDGRFMYFNLNNCFKTQEKYNWSDENVDSILYAIRPKDFQKTIPNRLVNDCPGYTTVDADQYEIYLNEENFECVDSVEQCTVVLSIKIAIIISHDGKLAGTVTFHTSGWSN